MREFQFSFHAYKFESLLLSQVSYMVRYFNNQSHIVEEIKLLNNFNYAENEVNHGLRLLYLLYCRVLVEFP